MRSPVVSALIKSQSDECCSHHNQGLENKKVFETKKYLKQKIFEAKKYLKLKSI